MVLKPFIFPDIFFLGVFVFILLFLQLLSRKHDSNKTSTRNVIRWEAGLPWAATACCSPCSSQVAPASEVTRCLRVRPFDLGRSSCSDFGSSLAPAAEMCSCTGRFGSDIVSFQRRCVEFPDQGRNLKRANPHSASSKLLTLKMMEMNFQWVALVFSKWLNICSQQHPSVNNSVEVLLIPFNISR